MLKITIDKHGNKYQVVYLREGVQAFRVNYDTKQEAQWMARMLRIAVRRHNAQLRTKVLQEKFNYD